jgi:hypothetical protein
MPRSCDGLSAQNATCPAERTTGEQQHPCGIPPLYDGAHARRPAVSTGHRAYVKANRSASTSCLPVSYEAITSAAMRLYVMPLPPNARIAKQPGRSGMAPMVGKPVGLAPNEPHQAKAA